MHVACAGGEWWARQDSNLRQHRYERCVLTAELQARSKKTKSAVDHDAKINVAHRHHVDNPIFSRAKYEVDRKNVASLQRATLITLTFRDLAPYG
jgi:hypothetical protein